MVFSDLPSPAETGFETGFDPRIKSKGMLFRIML
jgi:hypothetical protein